MRMNLNDVYEGDCIEVMRGFPDNCIDSIITDPPYDLTSGSGGGGFMGKAWDASGIAFDPEVWREALRVAKPGATLMAFGGTRTHHRLMVAIEDAGWEIRDVIMYLYGSGFPKSHNVSKGIDKRAGAVREVVGYDEVARSKTAAERRNGVSNINKNNRVKAGEYYKTEASAGFANPDEVGKITAPSTPLAKQFDGYGSAIKPSYEPIIMAMKPMGQSYADNAAEWGVSGLWIDGARVEAGGDRRSPNGADGKVHRTTGNVYGKHKPSETFDVTTARFPANIIHDGSDEVEAEFAKAGVRSSGGAAGYRNHAASSVYGDYKPIHHDKTTSLPSSTGSASRFFAQCPPDPTQHPEAARFHYCPKAPKSERQTPGNNHPTQKPLSLMKYLARLTKTPTGGIVLDPFGGSGTTALAALSEGRDYIIIEKEPEYVEIIKRRIAEYTGEEIAPEEFKVSDDKTAKQMSLW